MKLIMGVFAVPDDNEIPDEQPVTEQEIQEMDAALAVWDNGIEE